ncbi:hypothetical protein WT01_27445 [Burkholderia cepacia]|nr:hypothetical protein WT01_27445 [Burkholderia cepacia]
MTRKNHAARINIGIGDKDRRKIAEGLLRQRVEGYAAVVRTARAIFPIAEAAGRRADRRPADAAPADAGKNRMDAALATRVSAGRPGRAR